MAESRQYELVYIVSPEASEQEVTDLHGQIEGIVSRYGGELARTENWGRRRLAYPIQRQKEATYVLEVINGSGDLMKELDRRLKLIDRVMRHLIVRVDEELRVAERTRAARQADTDRRAARGGAARQAAEAAAPAVEVQTAESQPESQPKTEVS